MRIIKISTVTLSPASGTGGFNVNISWRYNGVGPFTPAAINVHVNQDGTLVTPVFISVDDDISNIIEVRTSYIGCVNVPYDETIILSTTTTTTSIPTTTTTTTIIGTTSTTTAPPSFSTWQRRIATLGMGMGNTCIQPYTTLYTIYGQNPITGVVLYIDAGLTIPLTGYRFMVFEYDNGIYTLNTGTGMIENQAGLC